MRIRGSCQIGADIGDGHQGAAQADGPIAGMVLHGVSGFVGGDGPRRAMVA